MNQLDKRLQASSAAKPRRPLAADFTSNIVTRLGNGDQKPERRPKWKEYIHVKLIHKPAFAALAFAAALTIGGSAYAAVGGLSGVKTLFGGERTLHNGARIVKVDAQNCPHVDAFNIAQKNRSSNAPYYYEIQPGSKLSNGQVVAMVQGYCEADVEAAMNGAVIQQVESQPANKNKLVGGYVDSVITAITPTSIAVRSIVPYVSNTSQVNHTIDQTFTHIDSHVMVVSNGVQESFSTLKVGDHVSIAYRATGDALDHSETIAPDKVDASAQTVAIITRLSPNMVQYYNYKRYNNQEFKQVVPCTKMAIGYCTEDQYLQK